MIRSIAAFHPDDVGEWVAELSCFHNQHIRHRPPFQEREWVLDPLGRAARIGSALECPLCDRAELPSGLAIVGRAGPWDQASLPRGLLRDHRVPEGRWGCLRVHAGAIDFQFESEPRSLRASDVQAIPPGRPHHVVLTGPVQLELEFWGRV